VTFGARSVGCVSCGDLTDVVLAEEEAETMLRLVCTNVASLQRQLVDVVDAEFEGAVLFAALMGWHDYEEALVAGLEEFFGEAVGIDDVELVDRAVFLNSRRRDWVDDFGNGVSRLEERVIACNENGRLNCVT
jgi:hypothetical protein